MRDGTHLLLPRPVLQLVLLLLDEDLLVRDLGEGLAVDDLERA